MPLGWGEGSVVEVVAEKVCGPEFAPQDSLHHVQVEVAETGEFPQES